MEVMVINLKENNSFKKGTLIIINLKILINKIVPYSYSTIQLLGCVMVMSAQK